MNPVMISTIDALLPQTQCGKCGHAGCLPYAEEIATGGPINRCPPGGSATIAALATLLERPVVPLDPAHGIEQERRVAFIREAECIGCTKCIQACPVDAILGAAKRMHTVLSAECSGCDLCLAPCPVDCIDMLSLDQVPAALPASTDPALLSQKWRVRYHARKLRLRTQRDERQLRREALARQQEASASTATAVKQWEPPSVTLIDPARARLDIAAAVARAAARKAALKD